ncbi:Peptidyl-tRNA hydrolase protein 2, mitochondrial, partial [Physocladia obscura]
MGRLNPAPINSIYHITCVDEVSIADGGCGRICERGEIALVVANEVELGNAFEKHFDVFCFMSNYRESLIEFLSNVSFTGLDLVTACVVSLAFAFIVFYAVSSTAELVQRKHQQSRTNIFKNRSNTAIKGKKDKHDDDEENNDDDDDDDDEEEESGTEDESDFSEVEHTDASNKKPLLSKSGEGKGPWKMVLLVRTDLEMSKGKAAAQCCHATLASVRKIEKQDPGGLHRWEKYGQAKITVKCPNEEQMIALQKQARLLGIVAESIRDAGRTQIAANSRTVCAIGP